MHTKSLFFISIFLFFSLSVFAVLDLRFFPPIESPETVIVGDRITFRVGFRANGAPAYNVKVTGVVDYDPAHKFVQIFDYVPADTPTYVNFEWTAVYNSVRLGMITFQIDPECTAGDSDYTNNGIDKPFWVEGEAPPLPDLKVTVLAKSINYKAGDKMKFQIKIENRGSVNAKSCRLHIKHGNVLASDIEIPPLAGHTSTTIDYTFPVKCNEMITILADALNQIAESDERNTWSKMIICNPRTVHPMTPVYTTSGNKK